MHWLFLLVIIPTKTTFIAMKTVTDLENYITCCSSMIIEAYTTTITTSISNNPTVSNRENGINRKL